MVRRGMAGMAPIAALGVCVVVVFAFASLGLASAEGEIDEAIKYATERHQQYVDELIELVKIPSISTLPVDTSTLPANRPAGSISTSREQQQHQQQSDNDNRNSTNDYSKDLKGGKESTD